MALPGFLPDAVSFGARAALALVLAYLASFTIQLQSSSSAGVCVAIVMQPQPGMALSKAINRIAGTLVGGAVALLMTAVFPQDRTMLLLAFLAWMAVCTFAGSLLRDFRAYGTVLAGYTAAIISISGIDQPITALEVTLDRVAAILIGIASVAVVNSLFTFNAAYESLVRDLDARCDAAGSLARAALEGQLAPGDVRLTEIGAGVLALRSAATYAAIELPGGRQRRAGARVAIAALLAMLFATRAVAETVDVAHRLEPSTREFLARASAAIRDGGPAAPPDLLPAEPADAHLIERASAILAAHGRALAGARILRDGSDARALPPVTLRVHHDILGALLGSLRVTIATSLGAVFCIYAGWPGATLLLVQQAAFTALFGMMPNPGGAAIGAAIALPFAAIMAGLIGFLALPLASGFIPFALAVGGGMFLLATAGRHPRLAPYGASLMLYLTLILAPANTESFDFSTFTNIVMVQTLAVAFMILAFRFVLPVSPSRRLRRLTDAAVAQLRATLRARDPPTEAAQQSLGSDRIGLALTWSSGAYRPRPAAFQRLRGLIYLDLALSRALSGLGSLAPLPALDGLAAEASRLLRRADASGLEAIGRRILADPGAPAHHEAALRAASGLYGASLLLARHGRALHRYGVLD